MATPTGTVTFLFTDVEGSTRLWEESPEAMKVALGRHDAILRHAIDSHDGHVFATGGDAFSVAFQSVSDGLDAALTAQRMLQAEPWRNVEIRVRMALHVGEADERDGDYFGSTVNRVARVMSTANGQEILVSEAVAAVARDALPFGAELQDLGQRSLKNLNRKERVFRVSGPGLSDASHSADDSSTEAVVQQTSFAPSDRRRRSIAVLPFDVMGGDADSSALADGLVEDIITALSAWRHFPVTARNSSFVYQGTAVDIRKVAEELGVRFVLEGSTRKVGNKLRVTAQLIDGTDGSHVWADRYDGQLDDVFDFQDKITSQVAAAIDPAIVASEAGRLVVKSPASFDVWDHYVRGRSLVDTFHRNEIDEGMSHLATAIELDPSFAAAHAYQGLGHFILGWAKLVDDTETEWVHALEEARRAVGIDPQSAIGHAVMSVVWLFRREYARAKDAAEVTLSLNPSLPSAHFSIGNSLLYSGDPKAALDPLTRATELVPLGSQSFVFQGALGVALYLTGDYQSAISRSRAAVARRSGYIFARAILAASLARAGNLDNAKSELAEILSIKPDFSLASFNQPFQSEQITEIAVGLRLAGLP